MQFEQVHSDQLGYLGGVFHTTCGSVCEMLRKGPRAG